MGMEAPPYTVAASTKATDKNIFVFIRDKVESSFTGKQARGFTSRTLQGYKLRGPRVFYILSMQMRKVTFIAGFLAALYGAAAVTAGDTLGVAPVARPMQDATKDATQAVNAPDKDATKDAAQAVNAPEPGSPGDTLTREDKRMAYLVYKLLDKNGKIKGANLKRGAKLFYQNCRPCHGEDGMRVNVNPSGRPIYIGQRAREDMPTFWYQMNFGDEDRNMEAYYDEITLDEMKDIAGYAQTLP
jgi:mono/diheme cytochrome c family protein